MPLRLTCWALEGLSADHFMILITELVPVEAKGVAFDVGTGNELF